MCSRSSLVLPLALAGCNSIFGLHEIEKVDAAFYDAHLDARARCPDFGTRPVFQHDFHQSLLQDCSGFTLSVRTGRAMGTCFIETAGLLQPIISDGPIEGPLVPAAGLQNSAFASFDTPRLGADGDLATVHEQTANAYGSGFVYRHTLLGWQPFARLAPDHDGHVIATSEPSAGPGSHILVLVDDGSIHEVVDDGTSTWIEAGQYASGELGPISIPLSIHLGADGLRMWFRGVGGILYADRASMADRFTMRGALPNIAFIDDGFITDDCGRLYFTTLSSVWFAQAP